MALSFVRIVELDQLKLSVHTALKEVKCLGGICYLWNVGG